MHSGLEKENGTMTAKTKYLSRKTMVTFYESLLKNGVISKGSAGYNRLQQLRIKDEKRKRYKNLGYKVT